MISDGNIRVYQICILIQFKVNMTKILKKQQIQYKKLQMIGAGAYGQVYKGFHLETGKKCAIKQITFTQMNKERIQQQLTILNDYQNENIVTCIQSFQVEEQNQFWIIMQLCEKNLSDIINMNQKLSYQQIVKISFQIFKGLLKLDQTGIYHLDLKPENILYTNNFCLKVSDFGCAEFKNRDYSIRSFGTSDYMPPQVRSGSQIINKSSVDIWSFGVIIYELIYGQFPIKDQKHLSEILINRKQQIQFPTVEKEKMPLIKVLKRILKTNPQDRATFGEIKDLFIIDLQRYQIEFENIEYICETYIQTCKIFKTIQQNIQANIYYHLGTNDSLIEYQKKDLECLQSCIYRLRYLYSQKFMELFSNKIESFVNYNQTEQIKNYHKQFTNQSQQIIPNNTVKQYEQQLKEIVKYLKTKKCFRARTQYKSIFILNSFFKQFKDLPSYFCSSKYFSETLRFIRN